MAKFIVTVIKDKRARTSVVNGESKEEVKKALEENGYKVREIKAQEDGLDEIKLEGGGDDSGKGDDGDDGDAGGEVEIISVEEVDEGGDGDDDGEDDGDGDTGDDSETGKEEGKEGGDGDEVEPKEEHWWFK